MARLLVVDDEPNVLYSIKKGFQSDSLSGLKYVSRRVSEKMDRVVLTAVLKHVKGNQVKASEILGISRTTLRDKLRSLKIGISKQLLPGEDDIVEP